MKKYRFYIGLIVSALLITACSKNNGDPTLDLWKQQNEQAFTGLANNSDFQSLSIPGGVGNIYYRVLQKGSGKRVFYNSRAEVYYKGWFVVTNEDKKIKAGDVFGQRLFDDGNAFKYAINNQVGDTDYRFELQGLSVALQYMVVGDKWEVYIPYRLGYGDVNTSSNAYLVNLKYIVPAYSTLAFEIELVKAIDPNEFDIPTDTTNPYYDPYYDPYYY